MHDTTTPSLATQVPPWRRRLLATALIVGTGMATGASATGLTSADGHRGIPPAIDAKDDPNYGPVGSATTTPTTPWTGDTKDHPNYGSGDTWIGDAKDHPNYGPINAAITTATNPWTGDTKDHPNYGPVDTATTTPTTPWTGDTKDHPNYGTAAPASHPPRGA